MMLETAMVMGVLFSVIQFGMAGSSRGVQLEELYHELKPVRPGFCSACWPFGLPAAQAGYAKHCVV